MTNRLSRRGFFGCIFGGIAAGTLLTSPAIVDACEQFSEDPIAEAVRLARIPLDTRMTKVQRMDAVEATYAYLNRAFDSSLAEPSEIHTILAFPSELAFYGDFLTEESMHRILLGNVPVAVARSMFQHKVPYDIRLYSAFEDFAQRYQDVVLNYIPSEPNRRQTDWDRSQRHQERVAAWRSGQQRLISGIPERLVGI